MIQKEHISIFDFISEQNRVLRTRGLSKNHPKGKLEPFDIPMSSIEKEFWRAEEQKYVNSINNQ